MLSCKLCLTCVIEKFITKISDNNMTQNLKTYQSMNQNDGWSALNQMVLNCMQ